MGIPDATARVLWPRDVRWLADQWILAKCFAAAELAVLDVLCEPAAPVVRHDAREPLSAPVVLVLVAMTWAVIALLVVALGFVTG
jgi:hypothetical protein